MLSVDDDFLEGLRGLDDEYAGRPVPARAQARVLASLKRSDRRRQTRGIWGQATATGLVVGVAASLFFIRPAEPDTDPAPAIAAMSEEDGALDDPPREASIVLGGVAMSASPCAALDGEQRVELSPRCRLTSAEFELVATAPSAVRSVDHGLEVLHGDVTLDVEHRRGDEPLRVVVSGGVLQVIGTRFRVRQGTEGGQVMLEEGRLRFVSPGGSTLIEPGETLSWASAPTSMNPASAHESTLAAGDEAAADGESGDERARVRPRAKRRREEPPEAKAEKNAAEISRLATAHRHRGAPEEAAKVLEGALAEPHWPSNRAEVWSYELGTMYAGVLGDRDRACAHWLRHRQRFGLGIYGPMIERSAESLGCE